MTGNGKPKCKEIKIATWNTLSLYRTGACQNLTDVLKEYHVTITALQEIRWTDTGRINVNKYILSIIEEWKAFTS